MLGLVNSAVPQHHWGPRVFPSCYSVTHRLLSSSLRFSSVQFSHSVMSDSLWPHASPPCPSPTPRGNTTHVHWVDNAMEPSHPLLTPIFPPSIFLSIRVFSNESVLCIRWPKYWSFSFNISPSNEYSGLIFFRMDWLALLAVSLVSLKLMKLYSILRHSCFHNMASLK